MSEERFTVELRAEESQYVLLDHDASASAAKVIGEEVFVDVSASDGETHRVMYHTRVSEDYGGQGLASKLVQSAVEDAIAAGHKIVPVCPYVVKWLDQHGEYSESVVKPRSEHLQAIPRS